MTRRLLIACLTGGVVGATCWAWVTTGSSPATVLWWLAVVALGVLLPGLCALRTLGSRAVSPLTDLAWSGPVGMAFTLVVWVIGHLVGVSLPSMLAGPVLAATLLAIPATRRRMVRRGDPADAWPTWSVTIVALAMLVAVRWMWGNGLARVWPEPRPDRPAYYQDLVYQVALTGELRRNLVPGYPMVNGEPLGYHWFYHAIAAQLGADGALDFDVVTRLLPTTLVLLLVLLAASVGRQVIGHAAGGAGAALAVAAAAPITTDPWGHTSTLLQAYWQYSPTATIGWVFGLATTACVIAVLRRRPHDSTAPTVLLIPFAIGTAGAKSAQLPVIAAGAALAGAVWVVSARRQQEYWPVVRRYVGLGLVLGVVAAAAALLLYPGAYGLRWDPRAYGASALRQFFPGFAARGPADRAGASVVSFARVVVPLLLPCLGFAVLLRRDPRDPAGWIGLGSVVSGVLALVLLSHPGASQWYFLIGAFPIALTISGAGLALAGLELTRCADAVRARAMLTGGLLAALSIGTAWVLARWWAGQPSPLSQWRQTLDAAASPAQVSLRTPALRLLGPELALTAALLAIATIAWLVWRRLVAPRPIGLWPAGLAAAALCAGLVTLWPTLSDARDATPAAFRQTIAADAGYHRAPATSALFDAGQLLRHEAEPTDIVATNRIYYGRTRGGHLDNRDFLVSAFSGLRTDVSGYGYAPRMLEDSIAAGVWYVYLPFWDQARLDDELALIEAPTAAGLGAAYRDRGVRWIVADTRSGRVSPALDGLAEKVFAEDGVYVYRVAAPTSRRTSTDEVSGRHPATSLSRR